MTPRELEWGSSLHVLTTTNAHGKALGWSVLLRYPVTSAIHRSSYTPLEANLTKVNVNTLIALSDLVEEYNVEWALASFDWERHESAGIDLDVVVIMEERVEGE